MIDNVLFVRLSPTPLIAKATDSAASAIQKALGAVIVEISRPLRVSDGTQLVPDLSVRRHLGQDVPELVMEMRSESTDRFALGPKRLVYARAGVPEYCFLDPQAGVIRVMRALRDQLDYGWPAITLRPGQTLEPTMFPGKHIQVADLLAPDLWRYDPQTTES